MSTIEERSGAYRQAVAGFDIFDTALWWAPQHVDTFAPHTDWERQLEEWRAHGMNGGLVTTHTSAHHDPYLGNDELLKLIQGKDDLCGCMVVTPDMFFKPGAGEEYLRRMKDGRVVAARMYPGKYRHSTQEYAIGKMCAALEREGMPLLVWHIDTGFDAIDRILTQHPGLKVVLESMDRKLLYHARDYIALMQKHENFYLETHNLVLFNEYETLCELVGSGHLVYGSYFPYMNLDFSLFPVYAANISDAEKQAIYAGNARKLFGV